MNVLWESSKTIKTRQGSNIQKRKEKEKQLLNEIAWQEQLIDDLDHNRKREY